MIKVLIRLVILIIFEFITSRWGLHMYMDSFFFVWMILFLGLFLFGFFGVDTAKLSMIRYRPTNPDVNSIKSMTSFGIKDKGKMMPPAVLALLIMFVLNGIGFLIYMR